MHLIFWKKLLLGFDCLLYMFLCSLFSMGFLIQFYLGIIYYLSTLCYYLCISCVWSVSFFWFVNFLLCFLWLCIVRFTCYWEIGKLLKIIFLLDSSGNTTLKCSVFTKENKEKKHWVLMCWFVLLWRSMFDLLLSSRKFASACKDMVLSCWVYSTLSGMYFLARWLKKVPWVRASDSFSLIQRNQPRLLVLLFMIL